MIRSTIRICISRIRSSCIRSIRSIRIIIITTTTTTTIIIIIIIIIFFLY